MKFPSIAIAALAFASAGAFAQASTVQRDVNQQTRIEQGLQSGSLTTREAGALEKDQAHVDRLQSQALRDGTLSPAERSRLRRAQNRSSHDIQVAKHNGVNGQPLSASSQRMQADVQRNVDQHKRIEAGVRNGSATTRETAALAHGQARVEGQEARAGRNGHVSAAEQHHVQVAENAQSRRIHRQKHDAQVRKPA